MRVVGVIAEYNPFHQGHAYHLREARRLAQADAVVVVMSTVFTQRGEAALLSPRDRAEMALSAGADAVFALPVTWAVRDAEHFALGGVALLNGLGCDAISFGAEDTDLPLLRETARMLESPDDAFRAEVQRRMDGGLPYPAAMSAAMEAILPGSGALLCAPNSTLAVCYLRAMHRLHAQMDIVPVQRQGDYHASQLGDALPSATALRGAILRGDWSSAEKAMPSEAYRILRKAALEGRMHRPGALDAALLYQLRTMSAGEFAALPDISEGIEMRLMRAAQESCTREGLLRAAKTRRYPHARLSRLATHALLGFTHADLNAADLPSAAWLLGFRRESAAVLSHLNRATLPILSRAADFDRYAPWFSTENRAYDLWALGAGLPSGMALTQGVAVR